MSAHDELAAGGTGGFAYWWRSHQDPVWNHHIREPVRFWSVDGLDEDVLRALAERRFSDLPRVTATPDEVRAHTDAALAAALARLREVHANYWERLRGRPRWCDPAIQGVLDGAVALGSADGPRYKNRRGAELDRRERVLAATK